MPKFKIKRKFRNPPLNVIYSQTRSTQKKQKDKAKADESLPTLSDTDDCGNIKPSGPDDQHHEDTEIQSQMTAQQHYGHLLHKFGCCTVLEKDVKFALLDYDEKKRRVKNNAYVFVTRRLLKVPNGYSWSLYCSCNPARMQYIKALPEVLTQPIELVIPDEECLHVRAMHVFLSFYDCENEIDPEHAYCHDLTPMEMEKAGDHAYHLATKPDTFGVVPGGSSYVGVCPEGNDWGACTVVYTKVSPPLPRVKCVTCRQFDCVHARCLRKAMAEVKDEAEPSLVSEFKVIYETSPMMRKYSEASARSGKKVQLFSELGEKGDAESFKSLGTLDGKPYVVPSPLGQCDQCGSSWSADDSVSEAWTETEECVVAYMYAVERVRVCFRPCSSCTNRKGYDGSENEILWFGQYALSHSLLKDYIRMFLVCNTPMHRYYVAYTMRLLCAGITEFSTLISYTKFRLAVIAMIRILDVDYQEGFHCTLCGEFPEKIVIDGTALGIQKTYMSLEETQMPTDIFDGSRFENRNFLSKKSTRDLLKKYCSDNISANEFAELKIQSQMSRGLLSLLLAFEEEGFDHTCPTAFIPLLKALASDQAVCGLVPPLPEVLDLLKQISNGLKPQEHPSVHMKLLQDKLPLFFDLLTTTDMPSSAMAIFQEIAHKSEAPFINENGTEIPAHRLPKTEQEYPGNTFPCLPQLVHRGTYQQDKSQRLMNDCDKASHSKARHATLSPGLFTLSCVHGICYGFQLMRNHESPNVPFTILRTRFQKAPAVIIYDNACKLHQYCLNRDPGFFRNSKFLVDKFHWKNHKGCSEGYNMSRYQDYAKLNSQAAEQLNSSIKPLASMLCYMDHDNFIRFTKLHMYYRNMLHKFRTVPDSDFSYKHVFANMCKAFYK